MVSDLHLGLRAGNDIARRPDLRARLVDVVRGADRLVLLGDVLELRERSLESAIEIARPLFEDLAAALGGGEIVYVPGNHDHAMLAPLAESVGGPSALHALETRLTPPPAHPLARLVRDLSPARLDFAYPGVWLDDGVYATHGHYMDAHSPVPMVECLAIAISARLRGGRPRVGEQPRRLRAGGLAGVRRLHPHRSRPGGRPRRRRHISARLYERLVRRSPDGAASDGVGDASRQARNSATPAAAASRSARRPADAGDRLLRAAVPRAVAALNRLGLGPFDPDISGSALRRAGLKAMAEVVERLDIEAEHVIFGHTHRPGPLPSDLDEWTIPARARSPADPPHEHGQLGLLAALPGLAAERQPVLARPMRGCRGRSRAGTPAPAGGFGAHGACAGRLRPTVKPAAVASKPMPVTREAVRYKGEREDR